MEKHKGWKSMPKGWHNKSVKKFSSSLVKGGAKKEGFFDKCVERMRGHVKNPEGFCAGAKDKAYGSTMWRGKGKSEKEVNKDVKQHPNVKNESFLSVYLEMIQMEENYGLCYFERYNPSHLNPRDADHIKDKNLISYGTIIPTHKGELYQKTPYAEIKLFYHKVTKDIYYFKVPEDQGSGYTKGYIWNIQKLNGVTLQNAKEVFTNLCHGKGSKKILECGCDDIKYGDEPDPLAQHPSISDRCNQIECPIQRLKCLQLMKSLGLGDYETPEEF